MNKTIVDVVAEKLNRLMGERGLSQYKLAHISGVPVPTIKSIMQKRTTNITLKTIILICNALQITPNEFVDEEFCASKLNLD